MIIQNKPRLTNFIHNIPLAASGTIFMALFCTSKLAFMISAVFILLLLALSLYVNNPYHYLKSQKAFIPFAVSLYITGSIAYNFYFALCGSNKIQQISNLFSTNQQTLAKIISMTGMIFALFFVYSVIHIYISKEKIVFENSPINPATIWKYILKILICSGFVIIFLSSLNASLWLDESFTVQLIQNSYGNIVKYTAEDVHPPLYYLMLKLVVDLCSPIASTKTAIIIISKLFSVLSFVLTAFLCYKKLKNTDESSSVNYIILCLFASTNILPLAVEIRMYGWAIFFMTALYFSAKEILEDKDTVFTWGQFAFFSICCAYTHYFALVSAGILWVYVFAVLLVRSKTFHLVHKKNKLFKYLVSGCFVVLAYLPWLKILLLQTKSVSEGYWISPITLRNIWGYFRFLFPGNLILVFILLLLCIIFHMPKMKLRHEMSLGLLLPLLTALAGIIASVLIRPIFIDRYLAPCSFCLWIAILAIFGQMQESRKKLIEIILIFCVMISFFPFIEAENTSNMQSKRALSVLSTIESEDIIYVDQKSDSHILYTVAGLTDNPVYYSGTNTEKDVFLEVFPNVNLVGDEKTQLDTLTALGKTIYYISSDFEKDLGYFEGLNCTAIGYYVFERDCIIYKIS